MGNVAKVDFERMNILNFLYMNKLYIPESIYSEMIEYCRACYPYEACGILAGKEFKVSKIYKVPNIEKSSYSYQLDTDEQFRIMKDIRENNLFLSAIFHSHPLSPAYPSPRDVSLAFYEDSVYIIISLLENEPEIKGFMIKRQAEVSECEIVTGKDSLQWIEKL